MAHDIIEELYRDGIAESLYQSEIYESDEYFNWFDTGCEISPHCLKCPHLRCKHDLGSGGKATARRLARADEIRHLAAYGWDNRQIARYLGVSLRTIQRALSDNPTRSASGAALAPA